MGATAPIGGIMEITLYRNFEKWKNSTKRPEGGESRSVRLKEPTTILKPSFILTGVSTDYNYCHWAGRYYWITDIEIQTANTMEIRCEVDPLASWVDSIRAYSGMVLYDTTSNTNIIDSRLNMCVTPTIESANIDLRSDISKAGTFLVSTTGSGRVATYAIAESYLNSLMPDINTVWDEFISGTDVYDAISGSIKQLVGTGSIGQNIRDVRWIPFTVTGDRTGAIGVGMYDTGVSGEIIDDRISTQSRYLPIPWQYNDWRNSEPYTQIYMYIPFVGVVSYSPSLLIGATQLEILTSLNQQTGDLAIDIRREGASIATYGASTGVSIPLGSSGFNPMSIANSIFPTVTGLATGNTGGALAGLMSAFQANNQTVGGISSGAGAGLPFMAQLYTVCHNTTTTPSSVNDTMGTPAFAVKSLSGLSGYVQTYDAHVTISGTKIEADAINSALNAGIYLE